VVESATIAFMSIISNCTESAIKDAATSLINGNLVAFPTETVYGLGADATNKEAVSRIYEVKGRPVGHPLIVHISSIAHLDKWAKDIPEYAINLARSFWPGPMTLILPRADLARDFITGGQDNVGIRVPSHVVALALLKEFEAQGGAGIAAPSANRFGAVSATTAKAVELELDNFLDSRDQILDGGSCNIGIESTIINCLRNKPSILRPGWVTKEMIETTLGITLDSISVKEDINDVKASGLLQSHYAPKAKIVLNKKPRKGDGFIADLSHPTPSGVIRLASPANNFIFAQDLYKAFRLADEQKLSRIVIISPENNGIGIAINDRLKKASSKYLD
jgi:L-threonylcarbamoyladenylate synthase